MHAFDCIKLEISYKLKREGPIKFGGKTADIKKKELYFDNDPTKIYRLVRSPNNARIRPSRSRRTDPSTLYQAAEKDEKFYRFAKAFYETRGGSKVCTTTALEIVQGVFMYYITHMMPEVEKDNKAYAQIEY